MWALRVHGYVFAVSFCFITLMAASQKTDPSEGKFVKTNYNILNFSVSFSFFCCDFSV